MRSGIGLCSSLLRSASSGYVGSAQKRQTVFSRFAAVVDMAAMSGMEIAALLMLIDRRVMTFAMAPETYCGMPLGEVSAPEPPTERIECPYQMVKMVVSAMGLGRFVS